MPRNKEAPAGFPAASLGLDRLDLMPLSEVIATAQLVAGSLKPLIEQIDTTLERELRSILTRIEALRSEMSKVRPDDISQNRIPEMGRELSAVVQSTEQATNSIMEAAEAVLSTELSDPVAYKEFVGDKMMQIFEACSFQDLTGQRVNKVVETVELIEERINLLCRVIDSKIDATEAPLSAKEQRKKDLLLNGPQFEGEGVDQATIDAMF